jgi:delta-aminolevulinic acid dehydratase/porphobilinogen synthase
MTIRTSTTASLSAAARSARLDLTRRPRRLRRSAALRALVRETRLSPEMFIEPLFVRSGEGQRIAIGSMPGVYQLSVDEAVREAAAIKAAGIPGVILFGLPDEKDAIGSSAYDAEAPVQLAVRAIKRESSWTRRSRTIRPSSSWRAPPCHTPPQAPMSSRPPT